MVCACQSVIKYLSGILPAPHVIDSGKQDRRKELLPSQSLSSNGFDVISTNKRYVDKYYEENRVDLESEVGKRGQNTFKQRPAEGSSTMERGGRSIQ